MFEHRKLLYAQVYEHLRRALYSVEPTKKQTTAVETAIATHLKGVWRFAYSLSGRADMADDLAQMTALRAMERAHQVRDDARLDAWLMTICRSIWLNEARAAAIRKTQSLATLPEHELISAGPDTETNIFAAQVFNEVMTLPEAQRETVMLVFVQGYSYREAAEILDVPIGTVMSRLSAARTKLRPLTEDRDAVQAGE